MFLLKILAIIFGSILDYGSTANKIRKMDMQPNSFKSDDWLRRHGKL